MPRREDERTADEGLRWCVTCARWFSVTEFALHSHDPKPKPALWCASCRRYLPPLEWMDHPHQLPAFEPKQAT